MVSINYATREVSCKIVFYGPGLSGKTTNLQYVHLKVPSNTKGKLISLATDADRTLYFDFLPINIGTINGFVSKFQLYTVPGQVYYNATRKLVLRGVDGLVFVADSQPDKMDENIESLNNLKENLAEYGYKVDEMPIVIQYNKQDLPNVLSQEEMNKALNPMGWPEFKASATEGFGVFDTLKCILKLVLEKAKAGGTAPTVGQTSPPAETPTAVAPAPPAPQAVAPPVAPYEETPITREPAPPQEQPSTPMAPAARQPSPVAAEQPRPQPVIAGSSPASSPAPVDRPGEFSGESAGPVAAEPTPAPQSVYRPFPGNTSEDEQKMQSLEPPVMPAINPEPQVFGDPGSGLPGSDKNTDTNITNPAGAPRMAPSLKADRPRKKRSFFKRLFGLK